MNDQEEQIHGQRVDQWLRHRVSVRLLINAPYLREVFDEDSAKPLSLRRFGCGSPLAAPFRFRLGRHKWYFLPGSYQDLAVYYSAILHALPVICRALPSDQDQWDFGPPLLRDMMHGQFGPDMMMMGNWRRYSQRVDQWHSSDGIVVHADIRRCFGSVDPSRLIRRLDGLAAAS